MEIGAPPHDPAKYANDSLTMPPYKKGFWFKVVRLKAKLLPSIPSKPPARPQGVRPAGNVEGCQHHCNPDHHYSSPFFSPPWMERNSSRMERTSRSTNSRRILRMAVRCSGARVIPARSSSSFRSCTTGSMATLLPRPVASSPWILSPIKGSPSPTKSQFKLMRYSNYFHQMF